MSDLAARRLRLAALAAVPAAIAAGVLVPALAATGDTRPFDPTFCPDGHAVLVSHKDGTMTDYADAADSLKNAVSAATGGIASGGSGSGDTVVACHGTFNGGIVLKVAGQDNVTVRSFRGPHDTTILGDGSATPVVSIKGRGQTLGGPGLGFTIAEGKVPSGDVVGVQVGIPGAQSTANEDETCPNSSNVPTAPGGCDQQAPQAVTVNDEVIDNVFTNFVPSGQSQYSGQVTGIESDNTINTTIQQNLFQDMVGDRSSLGVLNGIVVGTLNLKPPADANMMQFTQGDSTNINTTLYENAFKHLLHGGHATCSTSTAVTLNGYVLDAGVINNRIDQILDDDDNQSCNVVGISSSAYGSLENEQTGTIAPANVNIDDNVINQLADDANNTAIYLAPDTAGAKPSNTSPTCSVAPDNDCSSQPEPSSYTVISNDIDHVNIAVDVEALLGSNSYIRDNNLTHAVTGVKNGGVVGAADTDLDATNNFWGCPTGPMNGGSCATIDGSGVSYFPYLHDPVHDAGHDAGEHAGTP